VSSGSLVLAGSRPFSQAQPISQESLTERRRSSAFEALFNYAGESHENGVRKGFTPSTRG